MDRSSDAGSLFRTSFLEKGLVTFAECVEHYAAFGSDALLDEMRLLLTAPMLSVPFAVASARYYALMSALIRCAGADAELNDSQRAKLVRFCIDIGVFLRGRTAEGRAPAFDAALDGSLEAARGSAHPEVAAEILHGIRPPAEETVEPDLDAAAAVICALDFSEPPPGFRAAVSA